MGVLSWGSCSYIITPITWATHMRKITINDLGHLKCISLVVVTYFSFLDYVNILHVLFVVSNLRCGIGILPSRKASFSFYFFSF